MSRIAILTLLGLLVAGCTPSQPATQPGTPVSPTFGPVGDSGTFRTSADARAPAQVMVLLEIWQMQVPLGTISRNDDFWKRIDETCLDPGTADLLQKNGVRVGEAPLAEWDFFRRIMEQHPAVAQKSVFSGPEGQLIEMEMNKSIEFQYIFFFDRNLQLSGNTYDRSDNILSLSFQPTPRKLGAVRIALCPTVRSHRRKLEFNSRSEERELQVVQAERLFDCNLRADVPLDHFLIVAPASAQPLTSSIGKAFLMRDGEAEQFEQILLICPKPIRLDANTPKIAGATDKKR